MFMKKELNKKRVIIHIRAFRLQLFRKSVTIVTRSMVVAASPVIISVLRRSLSFGSVSDGTRGVSTRDLQNGHGHA
jgi:hypothetical protein